MFSGIVVELGEVVKPVEDGRLTIASQLVRSDAKLGSSVAVNGCCLTVVELDDKEFSFDLMPETLQRTNLGELQPGDQVNLEGPLTLGDQIGGHLVTGHIDATGEITERTDNQDEVWIRIQSPKELMTYLVGKGTVAIDGISLTIVDVDEDSFTVSLIPHTLAVTTAQKWQVGTKVNLETDMIAKQVHRSVEVHVVAARLASQ